ncbi:MAG: YfiR family protein [Myxococcota bacterium]
MATSGPRIVTALLALLSLTASTPEVSAAPEYQVKAAFLYNFAKFVEWPEASLPSDEITICILGRDPFGKIIDAAVSGKTVRGRRLRVRRYRTAPAARSCQLLFLARSERQRIAQVTEALRGAPVLIVSDADRFGEPGGMVNLVIDQNRVRIEINVVNVREAGLEISSRLLTLAVLTGEDTARTER